MICTFILLRWKQLVGPDAPSVALAGAGRQICSLHYMPGEGAKRQDLLMQLLNLVWKALCAQLGMVMGWVPVVFGPDGGGDGCKPQPPPGGLRVLRGPETWQVHYHEVGQRPSYTPSAAQPLTRVPNPSSLRASPTTPKKCPKNLIYNVNNKISSPTAPKTKPPYLGCPKQSSVILKFPRGLRTPNYIDQMCRIRLGWLSTSYLSNFECSDTDTDRILNVLTRIRIGS